MALRQSRFRMSSGRSQRRKTSWSLGPKTGANGTGIAVVASGSTMGGIGAQAVLDGITVVRIRGELLFTISTASALEDGMFGAFGIGIAFNPAFTAGIGSVPTPISEEFQDNWFYHRYFTCIANGAISAAGVSLSAGQQDPTSACIRVEVDSKAMRKLNIGDTIYAALEVTEVGTVTARWAFNSRMLVKQP